jgi:hypothetical protein
VTDTVKREALADAALAVLATDAEGAKAIQRILDAIFAAKPAVAVRIADEAKSGRLRPSASPIELSCRGRQHTNGDLLQLNHVGGLGLGGGTDGCYRSSCDK